MLPDIKRRSQASSNRPLPRRQTLNTFDPIWGIIFLAFAGSVNSQTTNATCSKTEETSWMFNELDESPCLVWSKIQSLCLSQNSFVNVPPLLDSSYGYNLPNEKSSICQCNSISYSLMSACASCQFSSAPLPPEKEWWESCPTYTPDGLGFNETVLNIPNWAWHVWSNETFDPDVAKTITTPPSTPSYATTLSRTFPITSSTSSTNTTSSNPTSSDQGENGETAWGPIIGGVAGGIVFLVLIFLLIRWFTTRNSSGSKKPRHTLPKRIPYPYPPDGTRTDKGKAGEGQGDSFLEMLESNSRKPFSMSSKKTQNQNQNQRDELLKRRTAELMSNPKAFADPRTAPLPFTPFSRQRSDPPATPKRTTTKKGMGYTTTSQRLSGKPISLTASEMNMTQPNYQGGSVKQHQQARGRDSYHSESENHPSMDFSELPTRPTSEISSILPSLYEPKTGAKTYRASEQFTARQSNMFSPDSQYYNPNTSTPFTIDTNKTITTANNRNSNYNSKYPLLTSKTTDSGISKYPNSQYTIDSSTMNNYPPQETILNRLKDQKRDRTSGGNQGIIGAALGSGKRSSWFEKKRWSDKSVS
ncbi:uncharacterized protein IL334_007905 [Kwoniella shivajii]|uniref:Uncharacterized protein n=1 Tax=Kwoniella shivajii TaxID=564305 RepID=A0ABZ1DAR7_9TREE|nr:hypothetical protein IL334_007905 [Kwoniella shivajii]